MPTDLRALQEQV